MRINILLMFSSGLLGLAAVELWTWLTIRGWRRTATAAVVLSSTFLLSAAAAVLAAHIFFPLVESIRLRRMLDDLDEIPILPVLLGVAVGTLLGIWRHSFHRPVKQLQGESQTAFSKRVREIRANDATLRHKISYAIIVLGSIGILAPTIEDWVERIKDFQTPIGSMSFHVRSDSSPSIAGFTIQPGGVEATATQGNRAQRIASLYRWFPRQVETHTELILRRASGDGRYDSVALGLLRSQLEESKNLINDHIAPLARCVDQVRELVGDERILREKLMPVVVHLMAVLRYEMEKIEYEPLMQVLKKATSDLKEEGAKFGLQREICSESGSTTIVRVSRQLPFAWNALATMLASLGPEDRAIAELAYWRNLAVTGDESSDHMWNIVFKEPLLRVNVEIQLLRLMSEREAPHKRYLLRELLEDILETFDDIENTHKMGLRRYLENCLQDGLPLDERRIAWNLFTSKVKWIKIVADLKLAESTPINSKEKSKFEDALGLMRDFDLECIEAPRGSSSGGDRGGQARERQQAMSGDASNIGLQNEAGNQVPEWFTRYKRRLEVEVLMARGAGEVAIALLDQQMSRSKDGAGERRRRLMNARDALSLAQSKLAAHLDDEEEKLRADKKARLDRYERRILTPPTTRILLDETKSSLSQLGHLLKRQRTGEQTASSE